MGLLSGAYSASIDIDSGVSGVEITVTPIIQKKIDPRPVMMKEFFTQFCNEVGYGIPEVFRQIPLRIPGVNRDDTLYGALQKCVYLGFLPNSSVSYKWTQPVTTRFVNVFVSKHLKIDPEVNEDEQYLNRVDFIELIDALPNYKMLMAIGDAASRGLNGNYVSPIIRAQGFDTLSQIYQMLKTDYRDGEKVGDTKLIDGAIKGMSESVGDIHTQYFPPTEAQEFNDQLNGSFE